MTRPRIRALAIGVVGAALALSATACGNSGAPSSGDSGAALSPAAKAGLKSAKATVAKYTKAPTKIGVTTPLKSAPPKGKTIVFMQCELPQCAQDTKGIKAAADAVGWNLKVINYTNADTPSLISGMRQALQYNPVAVALSGISYSVWKTVVPAYQKAGVSIIPMNLGPVPLSKTIPVNIASPTDWANVGNIIGDWFVADSKGRGHALLFDVPTFTVLREYTNAASKTIKAHCPDCKITSLNASLAQLSNNQIIPSIVSAVQRDPSINYVLASDGAFVAGLSNNLAAIGRSDVKIAGGDPALANEQDLLSGKSFAWTGQAYSYTGWEVVDSVARVLEGMSVPKSDGGWPLMLLTKDNVGKPSDDLRQPTNFEEQFKKLWKVS